MRSASSRARPGGTTARALRDVVHAEDPTRQSTSAMNSAGASTAFAQALEIEGLNYQGEGFGASMSGTFPAFGAPSPIA